jgi:uncharacterized protein YggT (Ycf19 family)
MIPAFGGGIDFTPMILILILYLLEKFIPPSLARMAVIIGM